MNRFTRPQMLAIEFPTRLAIEDAPSESSQETQNKSPSSSTDSLFFEDDSTTYSIIEQSWPNQMQLEWNEPSTMQINASSSSQIHGLESEPEEGENIAETIKSK